MKRRPNPMTYCSKKRKVISMSFAIPKSITFGSITETQLNKYPQFYNRLTKEEKTIVHNMLYVDGKFFDITEQKVKLIPPNSTGKLNENLDWEVVIYPDDVPF